MSEVASEPWDEIERQFSERVRLDGLTCHYNVSRSRIRRHANKLGWGRIGGDIGERVAPRERRDRAQRSLKNAAAGDASLRSPHRSCRTTADCVGQGLLFAGRRPRRTLLLGNASHLVSQTTTGKWICRMNSCGQSAVWRLQTNVVAG
jgi:hypothetical protein